MSQSTSSTLQAVDDMEEIRLLMMSLDFSGKTTILYKLKTGEAVTTIPTLGYNKETVEHKNTKFSFWDIGGGEKIRMLWRFYSEKVQGIIFVVDSSDRERIGEAKEVLMQMLQYDDVKDMVLLVFANKQDLPNVMTVSEITEKLDLPSITGRKWYVQSSSGTSGDGLYEGLDWLAEQLKRRCN